MKKSLFGFAVAMLLACTVAFAGNENNALTACPEKCCDAVQTCACATTEKCLKNHCTSCAPGADCTCKTVACTPDNACEEAACCADTPECSCN